MAPFGSLLAGTMAHAFGVSWTMIVNGCVLLLGAIWFFFQFPVLRRTVRPIYEQMGIIPVPTELAAEQTES